MKKILVFMLSAVMAVSMYSCGGDKKQNEPVNSPDVNNESKVENSVEENNANAENEEIKVMTHDEFEATELDSPVVVETYIQAKQSWWDNKGTFYTQAEDGAYFVYEMACTEEEYNKLVPGTKVRLSGYKAEWSGEVEIVDATFEILDGNFIATPFDVTSLLGTENLIKHQNELVSFKNMTVSAINYKNETPGDDIYVTLSLDEKDYDFCVEVYLTGTETEVYKTVGTLNAGDKVDVEGFLYWYEGPNTHITSITKITQ